MRFRNSLSLSSSVLFTVTSLPVPVHVRQAEVFDVDQTPMSSVTGTSQSQRTQLYLVHLSPISTKGATPDFHGLWENRRLSVVHYAVHRGRLRPLHQSPLRRTKSVTVGTKQNESESSSLKRSMVKSSSIETSSIGLTIASYALSLVGKPYVWGGQSLAGFDCSGLTVYVFSKAGFVLPRTSYAQYSVGFPVSQDNLEPGDLLFFQTYATGASHVAIYIGNGFMVQALNEETGVVVSSLGDEYYQSRFLGARRVWGT